jgi:excisionase family DNA binding protein
VAKYITIEEAAQRLGKTAEEMMAMMNAGELRGVRDGGTFKFKAEDVDALAGSAKEDTLMTIDADVLFAEGESGEPADAAAETWIAADLENVFESEDFKADAIGDEALGQVASPEDAMTARDLDPAPLPLSPEKDDTALGTVLMDGDYATEGSVTGLGDDSMIAIDPESGIATIAAPTPGISRTHMIPVSEPEPRHKAFTPLLVVSFIALAFALMTAWVTVVGVIPVPGYIVKVQDNLPAFAGGALAVALVGAIVGFVLDSQKAKAETTAARMGRR